DDGEAIFRQAPGAGINPATVPAGAPGFRKVIPGGGDRAMIGLHSYQPGRESWRNRREAADTGTGRRTRSRRFSPILSGRRSESRARIWPAPDAAPPG